MGRARYLLLFATVASALASLAACDSSAPRGLGTLAVKALAQTAEPFVFMYGVAIDSASPRTATLGKTLFFFDPATAGKHTVSTVGLPVVCNGGAPKAVSVEPGDTVPVDFSIICGRTTGDINVEVSTSGTELDADGYRVIVDSVVNSRVTNNGSRFIQWQPLGARTVALDEISFNCTKPPAQTKNVTTGATTTFTFAVSCGPTGFLKFVSSTTGSDPDPDGTLVLVGSTGIRVPPAGAVVQRMLPGSYTYGIFDAAPNCALSVSMFDLAVIKAGDTTVVNVPMTCSTVAAGTTALVVSDPVGDTLPNATSTTPAHDVVGFSARFQPGFLLLVVRFAKPVAWSAQSSARPLYGNIDLDVDEDITTGRQPLVNTAGGSAQQGVGYSVSFFTSDSTSAELQRVGVPPLAIIGRVRTVYAGDSVVVQIPLSKIGDDDGNMTISALFGTSDRITDILPNAGRLTVRVP